MKTIKVVCHYAEGAKALRVAHGKTAVRGRHVTVTVPDSRLDAAVASLDDADEVSSFEYDSGWEEV
jgi:hypothetical protein